MSPVVLFLTSTFNDLLGQSIFYSDWLYLYSARRYAFKCYKTLVKLRLLWSCLWQYDNFYYVDQTTKCFALLRQNIVWRICCLSCNWNNSNLDFSHIKFVWLGSKLISFLDVNRIFILYISKTTSFKRNIT